MLANPDTEAKSLTCSIVENQMSTSQISGQKRKQKLSFEEKPR
jgi:hypothetical protein